MSDERQPERPEAALPADFTPDKMRELLTQQRASYAVFTNARGDVGVIFEPYLDHPKPIVNLTLEQAENLSRLLRRAVDGIRKGKNGRHV